MTEQFEREVARAVCGHRKAIRDYIMDRIQGYFRRGDEIERLERERDALRQSLVIVSKYPTMENRLLADKVLERTKEGGGE